MERLEVRHRLFRRPEVGLGHDLEKRCAGAVEINAGFPTEGIVDRLAGIFLQMRAGDADRKKRPVFQRHLENTFADDGRKKLTDLIALGQVRVEVIFAIEDGAFSDAGTDAQTKLDRVADSFLVQHGQHAGHAQIHRICLLIRRGAKCCRRARENFRLCSELQMHLETHHGFPTHDVTASSCGMAMCQSVSRCRRCAALRIVCSSKGLPISWRPTGIPLIRPAGVDKPGRPARFTASV